MKKFFDKKYLGPAVLVILGIMFLLDNLFGFNSNIVFAFLGKFWPLFLIIPGVMVFVKDSEHHVSKTEDHEKEKKTVSKKDSH